MKDRLYYLWRYFFWFVSRIFCFVYLRPKFNLKVVKTGVKIPKPPFIMVSNHATFFDPWLIGHLSKYPISIMMNEEGFKGSNFIKWYLKNVGAYPKKKGESDIKAMKYTIKTLKKGFPVLIFPEGQTTWDGETQPIFAGVESIIKGSKLPLVMMNISGNFISKPWWSENFRRGKVVITPKVLSKEEVAALSKPELRDTIINHIRHNDLHDETMLKTDFKGPAATMGINRFLWKCPACLSDDTITPTESTVDCSECGASWSMDTHFNFEPLNEKAVKIGNLHDWSLWHKAEVKKQISVATDDDVLTQNKGVDYCDVTDSGEYPVIKTGTLCLTKKELSFKPDDGTDEHAINIPVEEINDYVFQLKTIFECRHKGCVYKFRFADKSPMKWVFYFRYLNDYAKAEEQGFM
ncbi:MAG: 1-acyl-sn-glycerol-3-phosphate acyltransferase [Deltaproteobacteria bacterium]|nr:1-acyl-sn-glycerol-3-phosphate acyltransferase [Deltaproteobacteria bacterium]